LSASAVDRLLATSVRQRGLVILLAAVFVVLGGFAFSRVPIDAVPDVTNTQVQVITRATALGPVDVETYVSFPIESVMAGTPGLVELRSISRAGISVVTLVFDDDVDVYFARQLVAERLPQARSAIPEGYGEPEMGPLSSGLGEVLHFEVKSDRASLLERRTILDWTISPRLRLIDGVVEVNAFGGEAKTLELEVDPDRLAAAHVGVEEVKGALEKNHLAVGGAYITQGRENVTVRGEGRIRSIDDLENVVIETRGSQTPLYVRDIGKVHYAPRVRYGAVSRDGRGEAVVGVALMRRGAHSGDVVTRLKETLADIQKTLPEGVTIDIYYDRNDLVQRTIHTVSTNLLEATALVILVLLATLASFRAGMVVALSIPFALLGVFVGMWLFGVSGNLLSLGAIDFGLVVDGAIIIIENAQRRLAERRHEIGRILTDDERQEVVIAASREVRSATLFGEAIIALVYVPILALGSVEGRMFRPMALTVLFALGSAFVLSLTLVPALASLILRRDAIDRASFLIRGAARLYRPLLARALAWPRFTAGAAVVAFLASLAYGAQLGREFLPKLDEGTIVVPAVRLPSVSLEESLAQMNRVEKLLKTLPEVTSVVCRTGRAEIAIDPMGINMTDIYVLLKPKREWTSAPDRDGLVQKIDRLLSENVAAIGLSFTQPIEMNTNDLLAGIASDLAVHIYGNDLPRLKLAGDDAVRILRSVPGAKDVRAPQVAGLNVMTVSVDRAAIARHGLTAESVLATVEAIGGIDVGSVVDGPERYAIQLRLNEAARQSTESVARVPVRLPSGAVLPLGQLTTIEQSPGPSEVTRERLQRRITVQMNVRGRDLATFAEEARARLDRELKLPSGYGTAWAGEYERLQHATERLLVVVPIALALILVLLTATFGAIRPALLIFSNVPMAVTGGVLALGVRDMPFSISAGVGFIALFGVAVLNGLVLVSSIERLRASGASVDDAVRRGAEGRLRPVLTTALVASVGFLPMALATGAGAEVQRPLATVVIGGILSSTLLTLLVLPAAYTMMFERRSRRSANENAPEEKIDEKPADGAPAEAE
jgi:cobalt-zinc-cadmium resistance protein CzcA